MSHRLNLLSLLLWIAGVASAAEPSPKPFALHIVDSETDRGVPLVELKTVSNVTLWSDSAGYVAIADPSMLGRKVYFYIRSHGYEFPADGFGFHGASIEVMPGGEKTLKIKRINLAERLYRVTGEGIYKDSVILGKPVPLAEPVINGQVTGQDSVLNVVYQGKLWWFWGDTMRQSYPLGHFSTAGATSDLPGAGGLEPAVGVNLKYFVDANGFSRPMVPPSGGELHWITGLVTLKDDVGRERMLTVVTKLKSMTEIRGRELDVFDDETNTFKTLKTLDPKSPCYLCGHPFRHAVDGVEYFYCGESFPNLRVKADWKSVADPAAYEAYAPNEGGPDRAMTWTWRKNARPVEVEDQERRIKSGSWDARDVPQRLRDVESKRYVDAHFGSCCWNEYRQKWVLIVVERGGKSSFLGEVWYAEADAPEGPWHDARKILTHDRYSFYNPVQHPLFKDRDGRYVYFEGTYATTFSRVGDPTPQYEYNQIMYRLDLSRLPAPK